jgi:hypothetical protein
MANYIPLFIPSGHPAIRCTETQNTIGSPNLELIDLRGRGPEHDIENIIAIYM